MNLKQVILQVATILKLSNITQSKIDDFDSIDSVTQKDVNLIVSSANEVINEIATEYLPLVTTQTITVSKGVFDLQTLSKPLFKIIKLSGGVFRRELDKIYLSDGQYQITYSYLPQQVSLDAPEIQLQNISIYALSYGVAREYCIISGNYSEAELWDSKFKEVMKLSKQKSVATLKVRRWY